MKKYTAKTWDPSKQLDTNLDNWNFKTTHCLSDSSVNVRIFQICFVRFRSLHLLWQHVLHLLPLQLVKSMSCQTRCLCPLFLFPALNDRKVVVCPFLLYQLLMRTSWRFICLFRRHLLHSSSLSRIHRWCFCTWGWTFSNIWICFLTELDKEYRQSPDRYSFPTKLRMSSWIVDWKGHCLWIIEYYISELLFVLRLLICFYTSLLTRCPKSFEDFTEIISVP